MEKGWCNPIVLLGVCQHRRKARQKEREYPHCDSLCLITLQCHHKTAPSTQKKKEKRSPKSIRRHQEVTYPPHSSRQNIQRKSILEAREGGGGFPSSSFLLYFQQECDSDESKLLKKGVTQPLVGLLLCRAVCSLFCVQRDPPRGWRQLQKRRSKRSG
jgi:hypothetical protein